MKVNRYAQPVVKMRQEVQSVPIDPDSLAEPNPAIPDHVPDDLVQRYGRQAGHTVKYHRSQRYRLSFHLRRAARPLGDTNVWVLAVMIFFWMVVAAAIVGGLVYAISLRPWVAIYIVLPLVAMFGVALVAATRMSRSKTDEDVIRLP